LSAPAWTLLFFVVSQVLLAVSAPYLVYNHRMDYSVIKDNVACVGATLDAVKKYIRSRNLEEYIVLLGDSVTYSGPGGPLQSVSFYMNQRASENGWLPVFNFAIPAAQMGDLYTLLLMLDERGISTDRVVLNIGYASFVKRDPDPPIVYWLEQDLRRLDPTAYREVEYDLVRSKENKNRPGPIESFLEYNIYSRIPILKYRDFVRAAMERKLGVRSQETGGPRPWFEKKYLRSVLKGPVYQRQFDPSPMVLDESNSAVYFLKRIVEHQRDKGLLIYMNPLNKVLMKEETSVPGFVDNMNKLSAFLSQTAEDYGFTYVDLTDAIPCHMFSDHLHLIADGYRLLADHLWRILRETGIGLSESCRQSG